jgi:hypothetical protein
MMIFLLDSNHPTINAIKKMISYSHCLSWYRIISMASPGVATQDTPDGQVAAFERAILSDGLDTILATGRRIAARAGQVR